MRLQSDKHRRRQRQRGFTLVETLTVIILIGILSILVFPRLFQASDFTAAGFKDQALNALRYGHKLAITSGCDVQAQIDASGGTYRLLFRSGGTNTSCGGAEFTEAVAHPQGTGDYTGTAPTGVSISNDLTIAFDRAGRPRDGSGNLIAAPATVTIAGQSISIEPVTGYAR